MSSVVGDSQISSTKYRRHLIAAVELTVSCNELCFARPLCLETDWNIKGKNQSKCENNLGCCIKK